MDRGVEFYVKQSYPIVLRRLAVEEGGGWLAEIPDLSGCMSDGETIPEAIENLEQAKRLWIATALKRGLSIPVPRIEDDEYSGRLTLRIPKSMHRKLSELSRKEDTSLNQLILSLLSFNLGAFEKLEPKPRSGKTDAVLVFSNASYGKCSPVHVNSPTWWNYRSSRIEPGKWLGSYPN